MSVRTTYQVVRTYDRRQVTNALRALDRFARDIEAMDGDAAPVRQAVAQIRVYRSRADELHGATTSPGRVECGVPDICSRIGSGNRIALSNPV